MNDLHIDFVTFFYHGFPGKKAVSSGLEKKYFIKASVVKSESLRVTQYLHSASISTIKT